MESMIRSSRKRRVQKSPAYCRASIEYFTVGFNDFFIPIEGIFSITAETAVSFVVRIDIDETVALVDRAGRQTDQII